MNKILLATLLAVSVTVLFANAQDAYAAFLTLDDSVEGEIANAHDPNWEFGVVSNGISFDPFEAGQTTVLGENSNFTGTWFVNAGGSPDPGDGVVYFTDSDGNISAIITASWETQVQQGFDVSTIRIEVQSSPECIDLGPLPDGFRGIVESDDPEFINGAFLDPFTGDPVRIPSNLQILFVSNPDESCITDVGIDIKPGSDPSSVSCKNTKGNVPVAVFGSENFDVSTIDLTTLQLNGVSVTETHGKIHIEDKNGDEFPDAVLHLDKAGVCEATSDNDEYPLKESSDATLSGSTTDETDFEGIGDIRIVNR